MYCACDQKEHVIAFHESKKIVRKYCEAIHKTHNIELSIGKIKDKKLKSIKDLDDLYLVRFGSIFIQAGYITYINIVSDQTNEDNIYCRDVLKRIIKIADLSKKEKKNLEESISIVNDIIYEESHYTPRFDELQKLKLDYDPYLYNRGII